MNATNPATEKDSILAIACGPLVTTWDISKSNGTNAIFDATKSIPSLSSLSSSTIGVKYSTNDHHILEAAGISQFKPFATPTVDSYNSSHVGNEYSNGDGMYPSNNVQTIVNDLAWNHNGQVLATNCTFKSAATPTTISSSLTKIHNIALILPNSKTKLESFSTFVSNNSPSTILNSTSLSFGGSTAKSRYICVSDEGGYISVWDLKKQPVKRVRYFRLSHDTSVGSGGAEDQSFCSKACIHPTDTFVIGLHGCRPDDGVGGDTQVVKLDLFHLKNGGIISTLQDDGTHGGSSSCFHCSTMDPNQILVGTNDGSLLLWDISLSNSASHIPPMTILHKCHNDIVTDVAFSPMNKVLAASCSLDGTIVFNDVHSKTKIQSLRPAIGQQQQNQYYNGDSSDFGLTSLAFHENGYTWAVGTTNGFVMNYDLRQINAGPLSTINVGDVNEERTYPVNCIQFAPMQSMTMSSSKTPKSLKKKGKKTSSSTSNLNIEKVQQPSVLKDDDIEVVKHAFSGDSILKEVECGSPTIHSDLTKITIRDEKVENEVAKLNKDEHREVKSTAMESIPTIQSDLTKISIRDDIAKKFTNEVAKLNKDEHREVKSTAMENIQFHEQNHIFSEQNNLRHNVTDDNSIVDMPTTADTSTILQSFDRMYERLKSRENQPISPFNNDIDHTVIHSTGDDDKFMMITKREIEAMIDDAVETIRVDMDDTFLQIQCDFMRQMQKQSDEMKNMCNDLSRKVTMLQGENDILKANNNDKRLF